MRHAAIRLVYPNAAVINGESEAWDLDGNVIVIDESKVAIKFAELIAAYPLKELREKRNVLLASSDWTGLSDTALTNEQVAKWKLYRQKLRDLPKGLTTEFKVKNVKWPTAPG